MMIPIDLSDVAKWGSLGVVLLTLFIWLRGKFVAAERAETERARNEILGKENADFAKSITESQKREGKFDEFESAILNDPGSVDTSSVLNSWNYLDDENKKAGQVQ